MPRIANIETGFYRIPLPVTLSDSTHGEITAFELITCRIRDADGAEGVGYTYTVGRNGGAVADILKREIPPLAEGREADDTEAIWHHVWWGLHYGGRGGPAVLALSALDIALWDLKARRAKLPLYRLLGGFDAHVPCYAGGIDLDLSVDALLKQTDGNLAKGFRAIKMKVGRPDLKADVAKVSAMREHLGDGRSRRQSARHVLSFLTTSPGWRSRSFRTTSPAMRASCRPAACRSRPGRICVRYGSSRTTSHPARCPIPSPTSPIAAASAHS